MNASSSTSSFIRSTISHAAQSQYGRHIFFSLRWISTSTATHQDPTDSHGQGQLELERVQLPPAFRLLDLPLELLHCIFDHLDPGDSVTLALSCKSLYGCFFQTALGRMRDPSTTVLQLQALHLLMEKDCGNRFFYCPACQTFHSFCPHWRATQDYNIIGRSHDVGIAYDPAKPLTFRPNAGCTSSANEHYQGPYHLARLVMNNHLLGPSRGLPLRCLEVEDIRMRADLNPFTWSQSWRAKIISNELFLSGLHRFSQTFVGDEAARRFKEGFFPVPRCSNVKAMSTYCHRFNR